MAMDVFRNLDLLSVGLTIVSILILGFTVYFNNRHSLTNQSFLFFACATIVYGVFNYLNYRVQYSYYVLWFLRITLFAAVWHAFSFFQLFFIFPKEKAVFPWWYKFLIIPIVIFTSFFSLTPFVFRGIGYLADVGQVTNPVRGVGMPVFGVVSASLVIGAVLLLVKKTVRATGLDRRRFVLVSLGSIITFSLILVFNVVLPLIFNEVRFVPLAPVFIFPFIIFTTYSIIRHKLLDIKVISTEILILGLSVALLFEVIISDSILSLVYRGSVFLLVLSVGLLLIKSIRKEILEREQVEQLAESLEHANVRLQELDKQKTEFLSIASHQLRTPLSIIKGYIELIEDGAFGKPTQKIRETLHDMDQSNERLIRLIDEFLDISRIEQGRTKFHFEKSDIDEVITSVVKEVGERGIMKGLAVHWEPAVGLTEVEMDEEKIRHVVFNFLDNAIKYSTKGTITLSTTVRDASVEVMVQDEGIGFNKIDEDNFFQKFYRGENVKGINVNGTGLGLFVCKKFIEGHGGETWARSKGAGKGSELGFRIPILQPRDKQD